LATRAVGALFRGARCIHINRVCENVCFPITSPSLRSRDILVKGRKHPVVLFVNEFLKGVKEHRILVEGRMYP
jgi:hypothetical protein